MAALLAGAVLGTFAHVIAGPVPAQAVDPGIAGALVLSATAQRGAPESVSAAELRSRVESAVLRVDLEACGKVRQGTVTMVRTATGPVGFTNAHVVRGATTATLSGAGLGVAEVPVGDYLAGRDVAEVLLDPLEPSPAAPLEIGGGVALGDPVTTVGFPGGRWKVQQGRIVAIERRAGWGGDDAVVVVDVPAVEGTSGGVVVDVAGRAVGLIAARDPRTGHTVAYPMDDVVARATGATAGC